MSIRGSTYILSNIKVLYDHQNIKILFISTREVTFLTDVVMQSRYLYAQEHCVNWFLLYGNMKVHTSWPTVYTPEFLSLI